jgi:hypothetical protein
MKILRENSVIQINVKRDVNKNLSIRPGKFVPSGSITPCIIIEVNENASEPSFPACRDTLKITYWLDPKIEQEPYTKAKTVIDTILTLFNRDNHQEIDIPSNTGVRVCQFLKQSVVYDRDEVLDKYYGEVIFEVVRSEGESFATGDAGNAVWI